MSYLSGASEYALGEESGSYLSGDIVGEIVGAMQRGHGPMTSHRGHGHHPGHHMQHAPHHAPVPHGYDPHVVKFDHFQPRKTRKSQVGVPLGLVASNSTAEFVTQPQKPFRPERLIIPSSLAGLFTLADFKVGNSSQFVSSAGEIPALAYSEQAVGVEILSDTAYISQFLVLSAHNVSGGTSLFSAGFFGTSVELPPTRNTAPAGNSGDQRERAA